MAENVKVRVGYNDSAVITGLANLRAEIAKTNAQIARQQGGLFKAVLGGNLVSDAVGRLASGVGSAFGAIKDQVASAFDLSGNAEQTRASLETMLGSAEKANSVMEQSVALANKSPYALPEITGSVRSLIAFGEASETVVATLSRVGDIASGVNAPIGEIAEIYGKARVQGTLFAEDINQLTGRGIPIIQEFAKQLGVSEGEVKKLASQGRVTFPMLEQAFRDMTADGGKFNGMMAKQSGTFKGLLSTLADGWDTVKRSFADPILDKIKPLLEGSLGLMDKLADSAKGVGESVAKWAEYIIGAFHADKGFAAIGLDLQIVLTKAWDGFRRYLSTGLGPSMAGGLADKLGDFGAWIKETAGFGGSTEAQKHGLGNALRDAASEEAALDQKYNPKSATLLALEAQRDQLEQESAAANDEAARRKQAQADMDAAAEAGRIRTPEEIEASVQAAMKDIAGDEAGEVPGAADKQSLLDKRNDILADMEGAKSGLYKTTADSMAGIFGGGNAVESINIKQLAKLEQMARSLAAIEQKIGIPRFTE